jgi:hypothetical protein
MTTLIDAITDEINKILSGNEMYNTYKVQWQYLLESYIGGEEYRRAGHLIRYQLETDGEYQARLLNTPLDNHCSSVIAVYNSFLFREKPERDFSSIAMLPETEDFLKDADLDGRSFDAFIKDATTWSSVFGHSWVIVSKPNVGAVTRADEIAAGVRPYVSVLTPLVVTDWNWVRQPNGRWELVYFKYLEDITGDVHTVKEWTKETIRTIIVNESEQSVDSDITEPNGLGKIPVVCLYTRKSSVRGIGISDIADIADCQKYIYNATSEIQQSIMMDSHPSLVKTPETQAGIGAGSIIHMPDNIDPGLKPYLLQYTGAETSKILTAIQHQIDAIDKMANTGAVRATESRTMSGVAMETEFQLLNAKLSEKADEIELAEEQIWKLFCEYMGYVWDGYIEYPNNFNVRNIGQEIVQLKMAAEAMPTNPAVQQAVAVKILEWMDLDDEHEKDSTDAFINHFMVNPFTSERREVMSEKDHYLLMAQGWVHEGEVPYPFPRNPPAASPQLDGAAIPSPTNEPQGGQ